MKSLEQRFWEKIDKRGLNECWPWIGGKTGRGYGCFRWNGIPRNAHKVSWLINKGEIPQVDGYHGMCVLHRCDNRACVNPSHLFLGTNRDNVEDCISKNRRARIVGDNHGKAKLTAAQVRIIKRCLHFRVKASVIGRFFGMDKTTIGQISRGRTWKEVIL
jgi:hypothetical protein